MAEHYELAVIGSGSGGREAALLGSNTCVPDSVRSYFPKALPSRPPEPEPITANS